MIAAHLGEISFDTRFWDEPNTFNPMRFIDESGHFKARKAIDGYLPFGVGLRACAGEDIAKKELFVSVCRLLQQTHGYQLVLDNPDDKLKVLRGSSDIPIVRIPAKVSLRLKSV